MALPVPPQPTTVIRTFFSSRPAGILCSISRLVLVPITGVMVVHEFGECLWQLDQILAREFLLPFEELPHGQQTAGKSRVFPRTRGVGKLALKECLFPHLDRCDRFLARNLHASRTYHAVVVAVPVRGHAH